MTKSLPIILQYLFTQNSNIYKQKNWFYLRNWFYPKLEHIENRFASLTSS